MASNIKVPVPKINPAQGVATIPLYTATGKWLNSLNFRFYRGAALAFGRKITYSTPSPTAQTLTIPSPTCQINLS